MLEDLLIQHPQDDSENSPSVVIVCGGGSMGSTHVPFGVSASPRRFFVEEHLISLFSRFGSLGRIGLPRQRSFALVEFRSVEAAVKARSGELECMLGFSPPPPLYSASGVL